MTHPLYHAESSANQFGGQPNDYFAIHNHLDATKAHYADARHRVLRHHAEYLPRLEAIFGKELLNQEGVQVSTKNVFEQHLREDTGMVPTLDDWLACLQPEYWMLIKAGGDERQDINELLSARYSGKPEDYHQVTKALDAPESAHKNRLARVLRFHSAGIFECEEVIGKQITLSNGKAVPVRYIAEMYIERSCSLGRIPTVEDWLKGMKIEKWMNRGYVKKGFSGRGA